MKETIIVLNGNEIKHISPYQVEEYSKTQDIYWDFWYDNRGIVKMSKDEINAIIKDPDKYIPN